MNILKSNYNYSYIALINDLKPSEPVEKNIKISTFKRKGKYDNEVRKRGFNQYRIIIWGDVVEKK